ncbi:MAG: hypothetical protein LBF51_08350 [Zoogloeaceae bacterium]|jgi:hypothetical protein|nr:hypothetical protein [Zoogloeaceae bacterium]
MSLAAQDVVAVMDGEYRPLFELARPAKASVNEYSKLAEHPVESGGTIVDNRVIQPTEIEMMVWVTDYANTYPRIKQAFNRHELFIVQMRTGIYENMALEAIPHEETAESFDVVEMALKFREVKLVAAQFQSLPPAKVSSKRDASTVDKGEQKPKSVLAQTADKAATAQWP